MLSTQDPQVLLSNALENRNLGYFRVALQMNGDPNRRDNSNISLFEKALQTYGCSDFVEECLKNGCKCDYINERINKTPINFATDSRDPKIVSTILRKDNLPVNRKYSNLTPLNSLAKNISSENAKNVFECMKLLLQYGANPNIPDQREMTPIFYIINSKSLDNSQKCELIEELLKISEIDLDTFRDGEARDILTRKFPKIKLPQKTSKSVTFESLLSFIRNSNEKRFIDDFRDYQLNLSERDNQHNAAQEENVTLLIEAISRGLNDAIDEILTTDVNINLALNGSTAIQTAAVWGNFHALQKLLNHEMLKLRPNECLLITVIKKLDTQTHNEFSDYYKCFYALLDSEKININEVDDSQTSALHYAVKYRNDKVILELLKRGAYLGTKSYFNDIPISEINPELLENYLDSCIQTNDAKLGDDNLELIFNYKNFVPPPMSTKKSINIHDEMTPVTHISGSKELRHLLQHPIITSFLFLKWHRLSLIFYLNFILYTIFCISLITFICLRFNKSENTPLMAIFGLLSFMGMIYMIIREIIQFIVSPRNFLTSFTNYMEILLIILTGITLSQGDYNNELSRFGAVLTIMLLSIELYLLVGSLPVLSISTHMLMLRAVSKSFIKSFSFYSIFVITFSLCFYILIPSEKSETPGDPNEKEDEFNSFSNPLTSIIKTIVMMTGEFDAGSIGLDSFTSYFLFLLFVLFMTIVLFNLLNGLAVSDTQAIKMQAELNGSICRANLLTRYERVLTGKDGKTSYLVSHQPFRTICRRLTNLFPNYINGKHIAILPNDNNKVLVPTPKISEIPGLESQSQANGKVFITLSDDEDRVTKLLDPPIKLLPCCCSFLTGKCSEMDARTVKNALAIIDRRQINLKEHRKQQETENRLRSIEDKIEQILVFLKKNHNGSDDDDDTI